MVLVRKSETIGKGELIETVSICMIETVSICMIKRKASLHSVSLTIKRKASQHSISLTIKRKALQHPISLTIKRKASLHPLSLTIINKFTVQITIISNFKIKYFVRAQSPLSFKSLQYFI
jgi:hypothetical protein